MRNKIVLDFETTGVSTQTDRIVEISLVKTDSNLNVIDKFHSLINPTISIPQGASDVHGIKDSDVKSAPTFGQLADKIFQFISGCDIAGYNSNRFDIPLLSQEFSRCGITLDLSNINIVDSYQIEIKSVPNSLSDVYKRHTGKELIGAHGAESDTLATLEILKSQIKKYGLPQDFKQLEDKMLDGNPRLDLGGKLKYVDGVITWAFGKYVNKPITIDKSYINWILGADFPQDLKQILKKYL